VIAKRVFDVLLGSALLLLVLPILLPIAAAIFLYDFHNPLYVSTRVGKGGVGFRMIKFRSMVVNADKSGVSSTSATDRRITPVGRFVRKFKVDELVQLWNVVMGDMSLVGPRPNVPSGVAVYTPTEQRLLSVSPGITDFASIVFSDEGEILAGHPDADHAYDVLIRPWKSRLGLFYIDNRSLWLDVRLLFLTAVAILSRDAALRGVNKMLVRRGADADLVRVSSRKDALVPCSPP